MKEWELIKKGWNKDDIISYGNMFLLGNGHLGYRGTLEEYGKNEMVGLNVVGFYDRHQDKWRESINLPNPFYLAIKGYSVLENKPISHEIKLDILHGTFSRKTVYQELIISSTRFISSSKDQLLMTRYQIEAKEDKVINITIGLDSDIYEINGPHFLEKSIKINGKYVLFYGITNENKKVSLNAHYKFPKDCEIIKTENGKYMLSLSIKKGKKYVFYMRADIIEHKKKKVNEPIHSRIYRSYLKEHQINFAKLFQKSDVKIVGNPNLQFGIRYSIYHLLILANENYTTSIPARGVSGETYKGAIFWDTEIFLLPFYTLTHPKFARNLLMYRINTLKGAKRKAKEFGYRGAFYAWESQDNGDEACSKYNVTDPITNAPVRTYFNEKQIHISADIVYALNNYLLLTGDTSILDDGGYEVMKQVTLFFMSYAKKEKGIYHINDVIGPDEYHERVNDNAFTNYMAYKSSNITINWFEKKKTKTESDLKFINKAKKFVNHLYLPKPNENGIIEQFDGYFAKEDTTVDIVRSRLRFKNEYWGTENGVAYPTRIIKQADVLAMICLLKEMFPLDIIRKNYDYYYSYTEHGSSLSASMYAMSGFWIGEDEKAYEMVEKSANIDLGTNQKMFAGGIYIGGTHPASAGGAYMSLVYGLGGLNYDDKNIYLSPVPLKKMKSISFFITYKDKQYSCKINKDGSYKMEETNND